MKKITVTFLDGDGAVVDMADEISYEQHQSQQDEWERRHQPEVVIEDSILQEDTY